MREGPLKRPGRAKIQWVRKREHSSSGDSDVVALRSSKSCATEQQQDEECDSQHQNFLSPAPKLCVDNRA